MSVSLQRESHARLSFADYSNSKVDNVYHDLFELSYINSGDQTAHLQNTHNFMVLQHRWLSQTQFDQIKNLCWSLPGPTTVQVIATIITLKFKSLSTGINGLLVYNLLPWTLLTLLGIFSKFVLNRNEEEFSLPIRMIIMGCTAAGAGIMLRSFFLFFSKQIRSFPKVALILLTALIFYNYRSQNSVIFCLALGGIVSLYLEIQSEHKKKKMSSKSQMLFSKLSFNFLLGKPSLFILIGLFFGLWIYFSIYPDDSFNYVFSFYCVGCLIIGPIDVIFAYFLSILLPHPATNMTQMWLGVPISFLIPGSHLNIGIYFGSLIDGIRGAILAGIILYIPCFLFLLGMLPQWRHYRQKGGIKRIYEGLVSSTTGLTLAVIVMIMEHCMEVDFSCPICIFIICATVNCFLHRWAFTTIIIGGILGFIRYISVSCYKLGVDCPFPFDF